MKVPVHDESGDDETDGAESGVEESEETAEETSRPSPPDGGTQSPVTATPDTEATESDESGESDGPEATRVSVPVETETESDDESDDESGGWGGLGTLMLVAIAYGAYRVAVSPGQSGRGPPGV